MFFLLIVVLICSILVLTVRKMSDKAPSDVNCNNCVDDGGSSKKQLPDGPPGYPLIGNLHLFRGREVSNLYEMMNQWAKQYGDIYSIKMGPKTFYILNGYELISEVFNHPDIDGRSSSKTFAAALGDGKGNYNTSSECIRNYILPRTSKSFTAFYLSAVLILIVVPMFCMYVASEFRLFGLIQKFCILYGEFRKDVARHRLSNVSRVFPYVSKFACCRS